MNLRKKTLVVTIAIGMTLTAGCSNKAVEPPPISSPHSSPKPTSTTAVSSPSAATPTSTGYRPATIQHPAQNVPVPKYPEAGKKDDKKGREAAAHYFMDAILYAKETGSSKAMDIVAYPECPECWVFQERAEKFYGANGWIVGGIRHRRQFLEMPGPDQYGQYQLQFKVIEDGGTLVYPPDLNRKPKKESALEAKGVLYVQYWPEKRKNVIMKYQTTSLKDLP